MEAAKARGKAESLVIGADFGTDSVRAVVVDPANGDILGQGVAYYPRWKAGKYCDPVKQRFRQHPLDYTESLEKAVRDALAESAKHARGGKGCGERVRALSVDTTGSTPVFADAAGTPLALKKEFAEDPDAMFVLWKDHTSIAEAEEVNRKAAAWKGPNFIQYVGGIYSSEWFWAKAMHVLRSNPSVAKAGVTLIEHCDWITAELAGTTAPDKIHRGRCAAGHKGLWHASYGGYPDPRFLENLDPALVPLAKSLGTDTYTADRPQGKITAEWAKRLGISAETIIGTGAFDVHLGALGGGIEPYHLVKVIGTSCCDVLIADKPAAGKEEHLVPGICGQVDGSIVPGYLAYEAGQSAFGDVYAWFKQILAWPLKTLKGKGSLKISDKDLDAALGKIIPEVEAAAAKLSPSQDNPLAMDWLNGRRTPEANQALSGAFINLKLGTDAPRLYRALVEATAYGSRAIMERFIDEGVPVKGVIAIGGISRKSPFVMQTLANVLNRPIRVGAADQACALGTSMFAAVVAGIYPDVLSAKDKMFPGFDAEYKPEPEMVKIYDGLYGRYKKLGAFLEKF
jgi:L-ribulokinase